MNTSVLCGCALCVCRGGFFHTHGYDPVLAMLLFSGAMILHCRQQDLKLRLDYLWASQVYVCACETVYKLLHMCLSITSDSL